MICAVDRRLSSSASLTARLSERRPTACKRASAARARRARALALHAQGSHAHTAPPCARRDTNTAHPRATHTQTHSASPRYSHRQTTKTDTQTRSASDFIATRCGESRCAITLRMQKPVKKNLQSSQKPVKSSTSETCENFLETPRKPVKRFCSETCEIFFTGFRAKTCDTILAHPKNL